MDENQPGATGQPGETGQIQSAPAPAAAAPVTAAQALDHWLDAHVRNSVYSRNTEAWNAIHAAFEEIKARLATVDSKGV